jgi:dTDP-N-acetylfucosamine:lipid II N-acetylfucosaminyltransferase
MILHVCNADRFIPPFITLVNEEFNTEDHQFWLAGAQKLKQHPIEKADNIFISSPTLVGQLIAHLKLLLMLHRSRKLILHGLFNPRVNILLAFCPWLLKKCYWVIWGGDLYQYQKPKSRLKDKVTESFRKFVIKRMGHLITYIPGDVELVRKWYGAQGEYHECLMYLSNVIDQQILQDVENAGEVHSGLNILIGNSADSSNNHIESLEKLLPYREQDVRVYVPLSYGDQAYASKVIEQGEAWFGHNFFPITSLMPFDQYLGLLSSMDIAIFNHKRQQAMGNTITLLGLGKTVYMRNDVSQWQLFESLDIKVFDVSDFDGSCLDRDVMLNNKAKVSSFFCLRTLVSQYSEIFSK